MGIKSKIASKLFHIFQKLGFHIMIVHYYSPIPDTRELNDALWIDRYEFIGIELDEKRMLELLETFSIQFRDEYESLPKFKYETKYPYQYYVFNGSFESVDGEILYCMIRYFKPKKFLRLAQAIRQN